MDIVARLLSISFAGLSALGAPALAQDTGTEKGLQAGSVRGVIDGQLALDEKGQRAYGKCIASISLSQEMAKVIAEKDKCKLEAQKDAYVLSGDQLSSKESIKSQGLGSIEDRSTWQKRELKKY